MSQKKQKEQIHQYETEDLISLYYGDPNTRTSRLNAIVLDSFDDFILRGIERVIHSDKFRNVVLSVPFEENLVSSDGIVRTKEALLQIKYISCEVGHPTICPGKRDIEVPLFPSVAVARSLTYEAPVHITCDASINVIASNDTVIYSREYKARRIFIGMLPILIKSCRCNLYNLGVRALMKLQEDPLNMGGYFIIIGNKYVVVSQEDHTTNYTYIYRSTQKRKKELQAEQWSRSHTDVGPDVRTEVAFNSDTGVVTLNVKPRYNGADIPVSIIFKALGIVSDREIAKYILAFSREENVRSNIMSRLVPTLKASYGIKARGKQEHKFDINTEEDALEYIFDQTQSRVQKGRTSRKEKITSIKDVFDTKLFPQLPKGKNTQKAFMLGYSVHKLMLVQLGYTNVDSRDSFFSKRVSTVGRLCTILFAKVMISQHTRIKGNLNRLLHSSKVIGTVLDNDAIVDSLFSDKELSRVYQRAITQGEWSSSTKYSDSTHKGASHNVVAKNFNVMLIEQLSLKIPMLSTSVASSKKLDMHLLHKSQYGILDPFDTPDGSESGLTKHLALLAEITTEFTFHSFINETKDTVFARNTKLLADCIPEFLTSGTPIFVNGTIVAITKSDSHMRSFVTELVELRRKNKKFRYITVFTDYRENEIHVYTDEGRLVTLLMILDTDGALKITTKDIHDAMNGLLTWDDLLDSGKIEYVAPVEHQNLVIATNIQDVYTAKERGVNYTHCRIHPCTILDYLTCLIPFLECTQGPRNLYSDQYAKYAIGCPGLFHSESYDTDVGVLVYPQKPLVTNKIADAFYYNNRPTGQNCIIAIGAFTGYNMEDAIIANSFFAGNGGLQVVYHVVKRDRIKNQKEETYCNPVGRVPNIEASKYSKLGPSGVPARNTIIEPGDVVIGKIVKREYAPDITVHEEGQELEDASIRSRETPYGIVENALVTDNTAQDGHIIAKVKLALPRPLEVGDKTSSREAQKGVIGAKYPRERLPFASDGTIPSLITTPHGTPSRMIASQLLELQVASACARLGIFYNDCPFSFSKENAIEIFGKTLEKVGIHQYCEKAMYNPVTGREVNGTYFVGPVFYQRLPQIAEEKKYVRSEMGSVTLLTRQPPQGKARGGGGKFGEMERDVIIALGASMVLKELFMEGSDKFTIFICSRCGMQWTISNERNRKFTCNYCKTSSYIYKYNIPYATKLLTQILCSMGIGMCIFPEKSHPITTSVAV
jgi:DNA-directed RNA polymerase beta subunit